MQGVGHVPDDAQTLAHVGHVRWAKLRVWVFDIDLASTDEAV
jgi:hypothetical protein